MEVKDIVSGFNNENPRIARHSTIAGKVINAPVGAVDTIGQGLFEWAGWDEGSMAKTLDIVGLGDQYNNNKAGARAIGDVGSLFVGGGLAVKGVSKLGKTARYLSTTNNFVKQHKGLQSGLNAFGRMADGYHTNDQLRLAMIRGLRQQSKFNKVSPSVAASASFKNSSTQQLKKQILKTRIGKVGLDNVAQELFYYSTLRNSDLLGTENFTTTDYFLIPGAVALGELGAASVVGRKKFRTILNKLTGEHVDNVLKPDIGSLGGNIHNRSKEFQLTNAKVFGDYSKSLADLSETKSGWEKDAIIKQMDIYKKLSDDLTINSVAEEFKQSLKGGDKELLMATVSKAKDQSVNPVKILQVDNIGSLNKNGAPEGFFVKTVTKNGNEIELSDSIYKSGNTVTTTINEKSVSINLKNKNEKIIFKTDVSKDTLSNIEKRQEGMRKISDAMLNREADKPLDIKLFKEMDRHSLLETLNDAFNKSIDQENTLKNIQGILGEVKKDLGLDIDVETLTDLKLKKALLSERLKVAYEYIKKIEGSNDKLLDYGFLSELSGLKLGDEYASNTTVQQLRSLESVDDVDRLLKNTYDEDFLELYKSMDLDPINEKMKPAIFQYANDHFDFLETNKNYTPLTDMMVETLSNLDVEKFGYVADEFKVILNEIVAEVKPLLDTLDVSKISHLSMDLNPLSAFMQQSSKYLDIDEIRTAKSVSDIYFNRMENYFKENVFKGFRDALNDISKKGKNYEKSMQYELGKLMKSYHYGFDTDLDLNLLLNAKNKKLFKETFGLELEQNLKLPSVDSIKNGKYKPIELTDEAVEHARNISNSYNYIYNMNRALDSTITGKPFVSNTDKLYLPYFDVIDKEMVLIVDKSGKSVGYVLGDNLDAAKKEADKVVSRLVIDNKQPYSSLSSYDLNSYHSAIDSDFSTTLKDYSTNFKPVKREGGYLNEVVDLGRLKGVGFLNDLNKQASTFSRRLFALVNRETLMANDNFKVMSEALNTNSSHFNVNEMFEAVLLNRKPVKYESNWSMQISDLAEKGYKNLRKGISAKLEPAIDFLAEIPVLNNKALISKHSEMIYNELKNRGALDELAEVEKTLIANNVPRTLRQTMVSLNAIASQALIMTFDTGMGIINVASHYTTTPTVISYFMRRADESKTDYAARIRKFGLIIDPDADIAIPSLVKIVSEGHKNAFDKEFIKAYKEKGALSIPWMDFLEGLETGFLSSKFFKSARMITQKSEEFARLHAYSTGYVMAKNMAPEAGEGLHHTFALQFSNRVIADFNPTNKPTSYSGALGLPFGLFKSFVTNYYTRIYDAIGDKDVRTLAVNQATQALLFGTESTLGYKYMDKLFTHDDEQDKFSVRLLNDLDPKFGEAVLSGGIWNLPALLGITEEGIGMMSRADVNPRDPSFPFDYEKTPLWGVSSNFYNMLSNLYKAGREEGLSARRSLEIVNAHAPVRMVRSMGELTLGYSTNRQGNVVSTDTRTPMRILSRLLSVKTSQEARKAQLQYDSYKWEKSIADDINVMGKNLESLIRNGKPYEEVLDKMIIKYLKNGGTEKGLRLWLRNRVEYAVGSVHDRSMNSGRSASWSQLDFIRGNDKMLDEESIGLIKKDLIEILQSME